MSGAGRAATAPLLVAAAATGYFLLPLDRLGHGRPVLSWTLFCGALAVIAALIVRQIRDVLLDRPGTRSGLVIAVLLSLSVLVFAAGYFVLARRPGAFTGLETRVDALYFTLVTLATIGYGDITPRGQAARGTVVVQILYSFVFLTAAATALSRRVRRLTQARLSGRTRH
ncbi:potassium channel family protein [Streptomyces sp. NPDC006610]|jgi:voltage-gated potassium channel Kch|uniref:potassium channel family protein n=1 Tax=Streptomyces sp. NPDC006610 TaxID=3154584 RepID=UPI0033BA702A